MSDRGGLVSGEVVVPAGAPSFEGAVLRVRLQDVSYADAPARTVATAEVLGVSHRSGADSRWPFELAGLEVEAEAQYVVGAHISRGGGEEVSCGDLVSTAAHPVLTRGNPLTAEIPVRAVGEPTPPGTGTGRGET